jgi:hypothetical protein
MYHSKEIYTQLQIVFQLPTGMQTCSGLHEHRIEPSDSIKEIWMTGYYHHLKIDCASLLVVVSEVTLNDLLQVYISSCITIICYTQHTWRRRYWSCKHSVLSIFVQHILTRVNYKLQYGIAYQRKKAEKSSSWLQNKEMKGLCYIIHCYRKNIVNVMLSLLWRASLFSGVFKWCTEQSVPSHSGFEVLTSAARRNYPFWDTVLCSLVKVNWHFRGTYCLHLHGWSVSQAWNQFMA